MTGFCSWSGGKDSCLSLYRAFEDLDLDIDYLINMINTDRHIGHGVPSDLIESQAKSLGLNLIQKEVTWDSYEEEYDKVMEENDFDYGVFGDIDIEEHRDWVEKFCSKHEVEPVSPLWGEDPTSLFRQFIDKHHALIVKIDSDQIDREWLGKEIDLDFLRYLEKNNVHPMGERGEYHTFVVDGPYFDSKIELEEKGSRMDDSTGKISLELALK